MSMLEAERQRIDEINAEMTRLFEERMAVSAKIAQVKVANKLSLTNVGREQEVIASQVAQLKDAQLAPYLTDFYRDVMLISKQYQAKTIKKLGHTKE